MMSLTPEEKDIGKSNFYGAVGVNRRDFITGTLAAGLASGASIGAIYFDYDSIKGDPVRVGFIGTGDEGSVLIGAHTPDYLRVVAISDIRPYNIHRAFHGDASSPNALKVRPGLMTKYGWNTEEEARRNVKVYSDYMELLDDPDIEAVVIAVPLHLHAVVAIHAMRKGKHVLTEKLMGHSVHQCKEMSRVAAETKKYLATGHQRHYSILYDNAVDTIRRGLIGDLHYIRAQWHRGNLPGHDSWQPPLPDKKMLADIEKYTKEISSGKAKGSRFDAVTARLAQLKLMYSDHDVQAEKFGYQARTLESGYEVSPLEELIRWRLWNRTGGGLMAELGSHQLDAASIFISAMREDNKKVHPLSVNGVGGRYIFPEDRDVADHVYCMYEFPGPEYESDPNKKVVVTYSSINGNGFGGYGETVLGTTGTLVLDREKEVMLYKGSSTTTSVKVSKGKGDAGPTMDTTASGDGEAVATGQKGMEAAPPSRGYTEELEHWAWCIRNPDPANQPKCLPEVALADATIALTSNIAIAEKRIIQFEPDWFKIDSDTTPEGIAPDITRDEYKI